MEIDAKEYREFLRQMLAVIKEAEIHITAHRSFFEQLSERMPELAFILTKAFEVARAEIDLKYRPIQESISAESSPESLDRAVKELLARWIPKGPAGRNWAFTLCSRRPLPLLCVVISWDASPPRLRTSMSCLTGTYSIKSYFAPLP